MQLGDALKDAPIPMVCGATIFGIQLNDLVLIASFIYIMLRITKLCVDWVKEGSSG